jgi:diguanylate cyclase (GGDEF)-like protein
LLTARAQVDGLTGLWNRSYFDRRAADEVAAARRYGRRVSLAMIDLDRFKPMNDEHGHPFGDRVLQTVGEVLATTIRASDAACRLGGDEFALILTETNLAGARHTAERVRERLQALDLRSRGVHVPVTASIGVASTDTATDAAELTVAGLLAAADDALYAVKRSGRDRIAAAAAVG